jgi:hypothetical protein
MKTLASLLLVLALPVVGPRPDSQGPSAEKLWARALAAKGGAERLHAIRNFVITESAPLKVTRFAAQESSVIVCEPPGRWWEFLDFRPGLLGFSTRVLDLEKRLDFYSEGGDSRGGSLRPADLDGPLSRMTYVQLVYFMETAVVRPRIGKVEVIHGFDVVHSDVDGQAVSFYLDRRTHLPAHVEVIRTFAIGGAAPPKNQLRRWYTLEKYVEISGLQIPTRVAVGGDFANATVEVNVDLDPALFGTPPDGVTSGDAWRKFRR